MIKSLFKTSKKYTADDLLKELLKLTFVESKVDEVFSSGDMIDINWQNEKGEGFLHLCASSNLTQSMQWLISKGCNIDLKTKDGLSPIFYAVEHNRKEAVQLLINSKANIDLTNNHHRTPLQEAVISGRNNVIDILMRNSHELNNIDEHGHNLVFDAVSNGSKDIVKKVIAHKEVDLNQIDNEGKSILHQKAVLNNNELAIELMEAGANPTLKDNYGKNFLFYAAALGIESESIIDTALKLGCNINSRSSDNQTIIMEVLLAFMKLTPQEAKRRESLLKMIKKLIHEEIDLSAIDDSGENALFITVRGKDLESTSILLEENQIDINHQNNQGLSVLDIAVLEGISNLDMILVLMKYGANPNLKDKYNQSIIEKLIEIVLHLHNDKKINHEILPFIKDNGQYMVVLKEILQNSKVDLKQLNSQGKPLFFDTILYKNDNLFKLLKPNGIDINQKDSDGNNIIYNLMHVADDKSRFTHKAFLETLQMLTVLGADVNSRDSFGGTTVHKAILDKCEYTVKVLLDAKADVKAVDHKGRTFIHNCVWKGKVKHFKLVHSYDDNILNKPDKFGVLPINYAAFMGQKELVLELIKAGAYVNNPHQKNLKMIEFITQFKHNLDKLISDLDSENDKKNLRILIQNMKNEFEQIEQ
jgi:ankyrin repeat protein